MNFARVFEELAAHLGGRGHKFGVVGAFALHAYGLTRATADLDLVIEGAAQPEVLALLDSLGYEQLYVSPGYSNHLHALPAMGRLDFVYVDAETAKQLFEGARRVRLFPKHEVLVPRPEHLAAMKVLAMKNDPSRVFRELADLQFILSLDGVDSDEIRAQFERHGLMERFDELQRAIAASRS